MSDSASYIQQMYKYAKYLDGLIAGGRLTREGLGRSIDLQLEVSMLLQIIGESAAGIRRCGDDLGGAVPIGDIAGLRNRISHGYEGIDWNIVEDVVFDDVPSFGYQIRETCGNV